MEDIDETIVGNLPAPLPIPPNVVIPHEGAVKCLAFSPNGLYLASAHADGSVYVWSLESGTGVNLRRHNGSACWVSFSIDGSRVASCGTDALIYHWNTLSATEDLQGLRGHSRTVWQCKYSPDGKQLATCSGDRTVRIWDLHKNAARYELVGHEGPIMCINYALGGKLLASASTDATARIWNPMTGACLSVLRGHDEWVRDVCFSPSGSRAITCSSDCSIRFWDPDSGNCIVNIEDHGADVTKLNYSKDTMVASAADGNILVISFANKQKLRKNIVPSHRGPVTDIAFTSDGSVFCTVGEDMAVNLWDSSDLFSIRSMIAEGHGAHTCVTFSPDAAHLVVGTKDGDLLLWNLLPSEHGSRAAPHDQSCSLL